MPKCRICSNKYVPTYNSLTQKTCTKPECLAEWGRIIAAKEREKNEKAKKRDDVTWKKEAKEKLMSLGDYTQLFQKVFNTYIRMRDKNLPCISCGTTKNIQWAAGHFYTRGAYPNLRFHEDNVHKQCNQYCNMKLSGNLIAYREGLINRIGIERFEALEREKNSVVKYTIPEVKELIEKYRKKIKELNQ